MNLWKTVDCLFFPSSGLMNSWDIWDNRVWFTDLTNENIECPAKYKFLKYCTRQILMQKKYCSFIWNPNLTGSCILFGNLAVVGTLVVQWIIESCRQTFLEIEKKEAGWWGLWVGRGEETNRAPNRCAMAIFWFLFTSFYLGKNSSRMSHLAIYPSPSISFPFLLPLLCFPWNSHLT